MFDVVVDLLGVAGSAFGIATGIGWLKGVLKKRFYRAKRGNPRGEALVFG